MDEEITVSPQVQSLQKECEKLRNEVARLLAETYDLIHLVKPNLVALYQTKLGAWELKRLQLQCAVARLKRKLSLIQASLNRGKKVHETEMEGQLDLEFLDWKTRVAEAVAALDLAKERLNHPVAEEEAREIRDLYRAFVKKLHPDLRPDLSEEERDLWHRVQDAYDRADLEELRALTLVQPTLNGFPPNAIDQLTMTRDTLAEHIARLKGEIIVIESKSPFTLQKQLADDDWIQARRKAIDQECVLLEEQRSALSMHVEKALALAQDGNGFSRN